MTTLPLVTGNGQFAQVGEEFPIQETQKSTTFYHRRTSKVMGSICIPKQAWVQMSGLVQALVNFSFLTWAPYQPTRRLLWSHSFSTSLTVAVALRNIFWTREWTKEIVPTAQWLRSVVLVLRLKSLLQYLITRRSWNNSNRRGKNLFTSISITAAVMPFWWDGEPPNSSLSYQLSRAGLWI